MNPPGSPRLRRLRIPSFIVLVGLLVGLLPLGPASARTPASDFALSFDGAAASSADRDFVSMGAAPSLALSEFTLEAWFRRTGAGDTTTTSNLTGGGLQTVTILVSKGRGESDGSNVDMNYVLGIDTTTNTLAADFEEGVGGTGPLGLNHSVLGTTPIPASANAPWHHAVATYDGTWRLYLDGSLESTLVVNEPPRSDSIQHFGIGAGLTSLGAHDGAFAGQIDEVRVWNHARSQSDIQSTMDDEVDAAPGLVGRWGMNEGTGTTTADSSGTGVNGVLGGDNAGTSIAANRPAWYGGASYSPIPGPTATPAGAFGALQLNGTNQYVTMGAATSQLGASTFTLETWFKQTGPGTTTTSGAGGALNAIPLVTKGRGEGDGSNVDANYFLGIQGAGTVPAENIGKIVVDFEDRNSTNGSTGDLAGQNHPFIGNTVVTQNVWHHVAVTYDSSGFYRIYLDGTLDATSPVQPAVAPGSPVALPRHLSTQHAAIGSALTSAGTPAGFFQGQIDETRIWQNVVRDQNAIRANLGVELSTGTGLHVWHLNETSGTTATDSGPSSTVAGTLTNGPTRVTGVVNPNTSALGNYALALDGFNDHVRVSSAAALNTQLYTAELWFNWNGTGTTAGTGTGGVIGAIPLLTKGRAEGESAAADVDYFLGISTDAGNVNVLAADFEEAQVGSGGTTASLNHPVFGDTVITPNVWHHAAVTFDGSSLTIYLDGVEEGTVGGLSGRAPNAANTSPLAIGSSYHSGGTQGTSSGPGYFGGLVDEVRVWNAARSQSVIQANMNKTIPSAANLVGRWGFTEGVGTATSDSAGTNAGTLTNGGAWILGAPAFANHAPTNPTAASIAPTDPDTDALLTATPGGSSDSDGDTVAYAYQWRKNGSDIVGQTAPTLNLATAGNGDAGDQISVRVRAHDGFTYSAGSFTSGSVTVVTGNAAPEVTSVDIDETTPDTDDLLHTTVVAHDPDGPAPSLSYQWKKNGSNLAGETGATLDLGDAGNGNKGDQISVVVTANDGSLDSTPLESAAVTIQNSAPEIDSATITPGSPDTNDLLSVTVDSSDLDNDTVTYTYQWLLNGGDLPGETGATLDLGDNGDKGNQISVEVTGHDGTANSATETSPAVTIQNSAPTISSVTIDQSAPDTNDVLTVTVASDDLDEDGISYTYQWRKNGSDLVGQTASTLGLAGPGIGSKGDSFAVRVTAFDGTAPSGSVTSAPPVTVVNTAPDTTVSLDNHSPSSGATITATATQPIDDDNDTVTLTYVWKVNGATVKTTPNSASLTDTLNLATAGNGDNGDTVEVTVTPNDGTVNGIPRTDTAVVGNNAPEVDSVTIDQSAPDTDDILTVTVVAHDDDLDVLTYAYQWTKGGADILGATGATLNLGTTPNLNKGNNIRVRVTANDGIVDSTPRTSPLVTIVNSAPEIDSATITPGSPGTNTILSVNVVSSDLDTDTVTYTYQWLKNGTPLAGETGATLNLGTPNNGDKGNQISVEVTGHDNTANSTPEESPAVTIVNTGPSVSDVSLNSSSPGTADTLTATVTRTDIDGDTVTLTYVWDVNGTTKRTTVTTSTSDTFDLSVAGNGDSGDAVTVTVTSSDGTVAGTSDSDAAIVAGGGGNLAPVATNSNYGVTKAEARTITLRATDPENNPMTFTVVTPPNSGTLQAGTGSSRIYTPVNSFTGTVTFTFRANDGSLNSNIATVTITIAPMKKITINDGSFNPVNTGPAICAAVRFVNKGAASHSVSDTTASLALFSSGTIAPNGEFRYRYYAAGNYTFQVAGQGTVGRAKVPLKISPLSGGTATNYTIQWACEDPPAGFVFDIQIKRGAGAFTNWQNGVTSMGTVFTPDAGPRIYKFRARLRNTAGGAVSGWSPAKAITVS